jgi:UDP:flavonoid glycosyltransferase YjiC (YdhE family)
VLQVINELVKVDPELKINLFTQDAQINYAQKEINFKREVQIAFDSELSELEISWIDKTHFTKQHYNDWLDSVSNNNVLKTSDLIVSDNHVLPARVFDNVVLMGSFLWHDSTENMYAEQLEIARSERDFLFKKKPTLLCLKDMVMQETLNNQVELEMLPWFTNRYTGEIKKYLQESILVTGGGTELINKDLLEIVIVLGKLMPEIDLYLDSKLYKMSEAITESVRVKQFDFTNQSFAGLKAILCRPGVGILTDCVRYQVPALVINDGYNHEIKHNANQVDKLGIGVSFHTNQMELKEIAHLLKLTIQNENLMSGFKKSLSKRETGGAKYAASYLINYLNGKHS